MSWTFCTRNGGLYLGDNLISYGYSGHGPGRNSPELETEHNVGPIPRGEWQIVGQPFTSESHGPCCLRLAPRPGTNTFGRSGFLIHGERMVGPAGLASEGCIILNRSVRESIWESQDADLLVVGIAPDDDSTPAVS